MVEDPLVITQPQLLTNLPFFFFFSLGLVISVSSFLLFFFFSSSSYPGFGDLNVFLFFFGFLGNLKKKKKKKKLHRVTGMRPTNSVKNIE